MYPEHASGSQVQTVSKGHPGPVHLGPKVQPGMPGTWLGVPTLCVPGRPRKNYIYIYIFIYLLIFAPWGAAAPPDHPGWGAKNNIKYRPKDSYMFLAKYKFKFIVPRRCHRIGLRG